MGWFLAEAWHRVELIVSPKLCVHILTHAALLQHPSVVLRGDRCSSDAMKARSYGHKPGRALACAASGQQMKTGRGHDSAQIALHIRAPVALLRCEDDELKSRMDVTRGVRSSCSC